MYFRDCRSFRLFCSLSVKLLMCLMIQKAASHWSVRPIAPPHTHLIGCRSCSLIQQNTCTDSVLGMHAQPEDSPTLQRSGGSADRRSGTLYRLQGLVTRCSLVYMWNHEQRQHTHTPNTRDRRPV